MKFSIKDFFSKCENVKSSGTADLVTFTEKILNGKLHFLCNVALSTSAPAFVAISTQDVVEISQHLQTALYSYILVLIQWLMKFSQLKRN